MSHRVILLALLSLLACTRAVPAGNIYQVTSHEVDKTVTYEVGFGGAKLSDRLTASAHEEKASVSWQWTPSEETPAPAMKVWDHRTGETIPLYRFPGTKNPLPVIPSIEAMKVCPLTGDRSFKA